MGARELRGAEVVAAMDEQTAHEAAQLTQDGVTPTLAILRMGENEGDISYERSAIRRAESVGVAIHTVVLPIQATQSDLLAELEVLNNDSSVHGVLMFRPLPSHIDEEAVRSAFNPKKDIDGITDVSLAGIFTQDNLGYAPCTAQACMDTLDFFGYKLEGARAVVIGRSLVVGKPLAMMLLDRNATVTIAHSKTRNLAEITKQAEIIISCVGRYNMLDSSYFSSGQTVIDVGINFNAEGKIAGDVDFESAKEVVGAITPVPGGVGLVTTSTLMKHVVRAARRASNGYE